ncbi:unnamed protein product, partial [Tetraodon nigroviridis]
ISEKGQRAPNGFYGEIDWDRYASPDVDEEGFSLQPADQAQNILSVFGGKRSGGGAEADRRVLDARSPASRGKEFFSSSDSEDEEDSRKKFKIRIKPLVSDSARCAPPSMDELKASVGGLALSPSLVSAARRSSRRHRVGEEIARPRRSTPTPSPLPDTPSDVLQNVPSFFRLPSETRYARYDGLLPAGVVCTDVWGDARPRSESQLSRSFPTGGKPPPLGLERPPFPLFQLSSSPPSVLQLLLLFLPKTSCPGVTTATLPIQLVSRVGVRSAAAIRPPLTVSGPSVSAADLPNGRAARSSAPIYLNVLSPAAYRGSPAPDLDDVFGPMDSPLGREEAASPRWVTFAEDRPPPPDEPAPPPPPDSPAPDTPSSTPSSPCLSPGPPPTEPPPSPPSFSPSSPASPFSPPDSPTPTTLERPPPDEPAPPLPPDFSPSISPPLCLHDDAIDEEPSGALLGSGSHPPWVLGGKRTPEGTFFREDIPDFVGSPRELTPSFRGTPPPLPPTTYRSIMSSPGPLSGSSPSSPARAPTPQSRGSPVPPPPPPRPCSRPKLPPGKPIADLVEFFAQPVFVFLPDRNETRRCWVWVSVSVLQSTDCEQPASVRPSGPGGEYVIPLLRHHAECCVHPDSGERPSHTHNSRMLQRTQSHHHGTPGHFTSGSGLHGNHQCLFQRRRSQQVRCENHRRDGAVLPGRNNQAFFQPPGSTCPHIQHQQLQPAGAGPPQPAAAVLVSTLPARARARSRTRVRPESLNIHSEPTTERVDTKEFWVNMPNLMSHLKKVAEQKPQATYYNVDMIKYQVSAEGIQSTPLNLAVNWRGDGASTDLRVDYKYNTEAMAAPVPLHDVLFLVPVDGGQAKVQAMVPPATWNAELQTIQWRISSLSHRSENGGESPFAPSLPLLLHARDSSLCVGIPQASAPFWAGSRWQKAPGDPPSSRSSSQARAARSRAATSSWWGAAIGVADQEEICCRSVPASLLVSSPASARSTFHLASQGNIWRTISEPKEPPAPFDCEGGGSTTSSASYSVGRLLTSLCK